MSQARNPDHPIDPLFIERWSPRAFAPHVLSTDDLMPLFEAARWAPSAFNSQPWRFHFALNGDPGWETALGWLAPFNAMWVKNASVLVFVVSDTTYQHPMTGEPGISRSHSFDTGAACANLALQAIRCGLHTHFMSGIEFERIHEALDLSPESHVEAAIAVGRRGDPATLPERLRASESPSGRKPATGFVARIA
ncbi:nitroreductase family protein [Paraburkholderia acidicola]|uniref:Nitroreductase family protein n=1 Tax=Paraburkholderia acidicola TaxID=1912599 RepID=A0ABV1LUL8_9BURK